MSRRSLPVPPLRIFLQARRLRKQEPEPKEAALMKHFQALGVAYEFEKPIGPYIVDFWLPDLQVIVEVDGRAHVRIPSVARKDIERDAYFQAKGLRVVRVLPVLLKVWLGMSRKELVKELRGSVGGV